MEDKKRFDKVRYNNSYNKTEYDRFNLILPKGRIDVIRAHAESRGESVNSFINRAIDSLLEREGTAADSAAAAGSVPGDDSGFSEGSRRE